MCQILGMLNLLGKKQGKKKLNSKIKLKIKAPLVQNFLQENPQEPRKFLHTHTVFSEISTQKFGTHQPEFKI
jgi:hypothetical protein